MKFHQRKILGLLEKIYNPRKPVHGFIKGRSAISNANRHEVRRFIFKLDIENFFSSISTNRVRGVLLSQGVSVQCAQLIVDLCTYNNELPQGAPTSPILSNMVCYQLDVELMRFAAEHNLRYTRFADDITFSGYNPPNALFDSKIPPSGKIHPSQISSKLQNLISSCGFILNTEKLWLSGPSSRHEVTGLVVNKFTNVKRTFVRDIRSSLHHVEAKGIEIAEQEFNTRYKNKKSLRNVIRGKLEHLASVRGRSFSMYRTLAKKFNRLFPEIEIEIDPSNDELIEHGVWVIEINKDTSSGCLNSQGTAVFVKGIGLVSADHIFWDLPDGIELEISRPKHLKTYKVSKAVGSKHIDICSLEHDIPESEFMELELGNNLPQQGDSISAIGFPSYTRGNNITIQDG